MDWKSEPNKRALAILRVSSHRQTDNFSHELQESEIQDYCKRHQLTLVEVRKITESAKNSEKRHQYNAALDWALGNGCLHVLFFVADRESRNLQDVEQNEKSVREGKICIHYVRDNRVLHKTSPDGDFFLRDILAASNKQFVRTLSGKVSDAMRKKAQEGWLPSNHVPLGYVHQRNKDENGREKKRGTTIVPDSNPQTIRLVLREFELRAQCYSYDAIHETTIAEGLVLNRKTYSRSGIEKRLKNPFYSGEFDWDGVRYKGKHQLIIPKDLLQQVQQSFRSRGYNPRIGQSPFPSGWLKCAYPECGCYITFDPKTKTLKGSKEKLTFEYFRCSNGKKIHKSMRGLHFKEPEIWKMLEEPVKEVTLSPQFADEVWSEFKKVHAEFKIQKKIEMDGFREGLKKLEGAEDRLYDE